jgi:hypothetical protein
MSKRLATAVAAVTVLAASAVVAPAATARPAKPVRVALSEYKLPARTMDVLRDRWIAQLRSRYGTNVWAPMRYELGDRELKLMGLPSRRWLIAHRGTFSKPTMVDRQGRKTRVALPTVATYAGAGYFGIRPGAWLLLVTASSVGWCSLAHVYGAPGSYSVSTAGHCGKAGDVASVIAAFGNRAGALNPILLDFGTFSRSTGDAGLGKDWALIGVTAAYQSLVTPTMAFWGGPRGMFTTQGQVATIDPNVTVNPDPKLFQQIVHYGHGTGVGAGGTPRSGTSISWAADHFMFVGAISPGDSGSGSNTLAGDNPGDVLEAAGINTHLWIDALMRDGVGIMGGTRATQVGGTLAIGQLLSPPVPESITP